MVLQNQMLNPGDIVRHFKRELVDPAGTGYLYKIIGVAVHSETEEKMMVYQALYGDRKMYVRPYDMFFELVDRVKYPEIKQELRFRRASVEDLQALEK